MAKQNIAVIGGGEHARVMIDTLRCDDRWNVVGYTDAKENAETSRRTQAPYLGTDEAVAKLASDVSLVLGVGSRGTDPRRRRIVDALAVNAGRWAVVVHPTAYVSKSASLAPGAAVLANAVVSTGVHVGAHAIVDIGATVDHDVMIGDYAILSSNVAVAGGVKIGADSYLGAGCVIRDHIAVAQGTMVGMGAVVTKEFQPGLTLVGVPAQPFAK